VRPYVCMYGVCVSAFVHACGVVARVCGVCLRAWCACMVCARAWCVFVCVCVRVKKAANQVYIQVQ